MAVQFSTSRGSPRRSWPTTLPSVRFGSVVEARLSLQGTKAQRPQDLPAAWVSWDRRLRGPEWTLPVLTERRAALQRDALELAALLEEPPPDWTGDRWMEMFRRLQRWEGQICALSVAILRLESRPDPSPSSSSSPKSAATTPGQLSIFSDAGCGTGGPTSQSEWDPFADE